MRASRLLVILMLLQARERMTAQELADALEVSVRTVYRDMDSLAAAGVPLQAEAGHDGGYRLVGGYRTRLTGLSAGEADALFLTGVPSAAADLGLGPARSAAQHKLMAALPAELRERAGRVGERFHLDTSPWYRDTDSAPALLPVADAVWSGRALRLRYVRWQRPRSVTRTVEPYGLVLKAGRWYLVARSPSGVRTYRVSRIASAEILDGTFERPAGFDLADCWTGYLRDFDARRYQGEATLLLARELVDGGPELLDSDLVRAAGAAVRLGQAVPAGDGRVRVTVPIESVDQVLPEILRLGALAEVLAPAELRTRLVTTLSTMTAAYT